jgi:hypothetical protein
MALEINERKGMATAQRLPDIPCFCVFYSSLFGVSVCLCSAGDGEDDGDVDIGLCVFCLRFPCLSFFVLLVFLFCSRPLCSLVASGFLVRRPPARPRPSVQGAVQPETRLALVRWLANASLCFCLVCFSIRPLFFFSTFSWFVLFSSSLFFFSVNLRFFFSVFPSIFFFLRPFSGFYKAREGLVSLPPEMVGIVEVRDHGRIVGIVAMICWIFPC